jgi:hypothetical protein
MVKSHAINYTEFSNLGGSSGGSGIYDYIINLNGSTYEAHNRVGTLIYSGTFDSVVASCRSALNTGGVIHLKGNTTYNLTVGALSFVGNHQFFTQQIIFEGEGWNTVIAQTVANANGIEVSQAMNIYFRDFRILMPTNNTGHGIYGMDTGTIGYGAKCCMSFGGIDNLFVSGCDINHYPIWLKNPMSIHVGFIVVYDEHEHGLVIDGTDTTYQAGNCFLADIYGDVLIQSKISGCSINDITIAKMSNGGRLALLVENGGGLVNIRVSGIDIERGTGSCISVISNGGIIRDCSFEGYISCGYPATGVTTNTGGSRYNLGINSIGGTSTVIINDTSNDIANEFNLMLWTALDYIASQFVSTSGKFTWRGWDSGYNRISNPTTIVQASTADQATIPHYVGLTPTWAVITGDGSAPTNIIGEKASVRSSTTCTANIKTPANAAGTTQTVTLKAGWHN